jgi:hypothetical protein
VATVADGAIVAQLGMRSFGSSLPSKMNDLHLGEGIVLLRPVFF